MLRGAMRMSAAVFAAAGMVVPAKLADAQSPGALRDLAGPGGCWSIEAVDNCSIGRALNRVHNVSMSPDGRFIYSAAGASEDPPHDTGALGVFRRDERTGGITQLSGRQGCLKRPNADNGQEGCGAARAIEFLRFSTVSGDGRFLYTGGIHGIAVFRRNARTGTVTQLPGRRGCYSVQLRETCTPARAIRYVEDIEFSQDGRFAYAVSAEYDSLSIFRRDPQTGGLRQLPGSRGCVTVADLDTPSVRSCRKAYGLRMARGVTLSPNGRFLYVAGMGDALAVFRVDQDRGDVRQLPGSRGCFSDRTTAEPGNGPCTKVRGLRGTHKVTISADGRFAYAAGKRGGGMGSSLTVFRADARRGDLRQLAGAAGCITEDAQDGCFKGRVIDGAHHALIERTGRFLYLSSDKAKGGMAVFRRDQQTGALTQLPGADGCNAPAPAHENCTESRRTGGTHFAVVSPDNRFLYVAGESTRAVIVLRRVG